MEYRKHIKIGRVIARLDFIACITIDRDDKQNTFDIVITFKNGHIEIADKYINYHEAKNRLTQIFVSSFNYGQKKDCETVRQKYHEPDCVCFD